jgi:hypothetical protein
MSTNLTEGSVVVIDGKSYVYSDYYKLLNRVDTEDKERSVMCPECHGTQFEIGYGSFECIATCKCGHRMVVYDG